MCDCGCLYFMFYLSLISNNPLSYWFNSRFKQEISGDELVNILQIKNKIPRSKALSALEDRVLTILTEEGYVSKAEYSKTSELLLEIEDEDDDEEDEVVDGEVDEGDVHITPMSRKRTPLVSFLP